MQALRAVAVVIVVLYHLWPTRLTGGFVGVDVFFVISGFLITAHLLRELARTGTISLPRFWARRARRLLPASLLVLFVVLLTTIAFLPDSYWRQWIGEIGASALYVQNWLLAFNAVDYLAAENAASPVQHFWSLSLEEQFYLVWPVLLVLAALASRKRSAKTKRVVLLSTLGVIGVGSFATSVIWTSVMPASAYFVTPTRMWEFVLGGVLAFVPTLLDSRSAALRSVVSLAGFAAVAVSAFTFTGDMAFPGYVALVPVLGAVAVIAAGAPVSRFSPAPVFGLRPVQFVGDISYSIYLWHWPLIVIVPILHASPLGTRQKLAILAVSVLLGWLSKTFVEDRFRTSSTVQRARPRWVILVAVAGSVALASSGGFAVSTLDARNAEAAQATLDGSTGECFGAAAIVDADGCADPFSNTGAMTPAFAKTDTNYVADPAGGWMCETPRGDSAIRNCELGNTTAPVRTVAMMGDSHSMHYMAALDALATQNGWKVITYFKSACNGTGANDVVLLVRPDDQQPCADWGMASQQSIIDDVAIDTVIFANVSEAYFQDNGAETIQPTRYTTMFDRFTAAGKKVVVIRDLPRTANDADGPDCLAANPDDQAPCTTRASVSLHADAAAEAAASSTDDAVRVADLTEEFCRSDICYARIGGAIVYSDAGHLTNTYARTLAPFIAAAIDE